MLRSLASEVDASGAWPAKSLDLLAEAGVYRWFVPTAYGGLGWDEGRLPNPVFDGDTIYSRSEVLAKRESNSRPTVGIVTVKSTGFNQDGKIVIEFKRTFMVYKRAAPEVSDMYPGTDEDWTV